MKPCRLTLFLAALLLTMAGCQKDDEAIIDTEYPVIDISAADAFPKQCSSIERGQKITFKATFTDNLELGSFSLDIHHNFDHHTHSTEVEKCDLDAVKMPVDPYLFIRNYDIPAGQKTYEATAELTVPAGADPGDYHFMIRLTDKEGWQTIKGLSIKIK